MMSLARSAALALALLFGALLAGCAPRVSQNVVRNPTDFAAPTVPDRSLAGADYALGALDTVTMSVFQVPDLTGDYQIDPAGNLTLPLVGQVQAQGKTIPALQAELRQRYASRYLQNPDIRLEIKQALSQRITIDGAVNSPGVYPVNGEVTLMQAIATAKGTTGDANTGRVVVFRKINGQRQAAAFNLAMIRAGRLPDPQIYGNDIVVVDGSQIRKGFREVLNTIPVLAVFGIFQ